MNIETRRPCPACHSTGARFCGSKNGFDIYVCRDCESIFTSQLPAQGETEDYDEYYTADNLTVPGFILERVGEIIGGFARYRETNRLLDIGFGAGTILDVAKQQNWDAFGTEVSLPAFEYARRSGHKVHHGILSSAAYPDDHFDVITASEILEHLPDPEAELAEIARILRPGGLFLATTPFAKSMSFRLLKQNWTVLSPPEHTQLYSKKGAMLMLRRAGFSHITLKTLGLNPAEIIDHYRTRKNDDTAFDRVGTGYDLNEKMTSSPLRKGIKNALNGALNVMQLGDSLKIFAEKSSEDKYQ